LLLSVNAAAEEEAAPLGFQPEAMGSVFPSLWRLFGALLVVLALVWGTMWVARRFLKGRFNGTARSNLKVVERMYLAPKRSIELVSIGERILVLGVTENQISMLTELEADEWPSEAAKAALNPGAAPDTNPSNDLWSKFGRRLNDALKRVRSTDSVPAIAPEGSVKG
jgi:flagellar protein FliO/FliZ